MPYLVRERGLPITATSIFNTCHPLMTGGRPTASSPEPLPPFLNEAIERGPVPIGAARWCYQVTDPLRLFDLNVNAGRQIQAYQGINRLGAGLYHVNQTLVSADLKLFPRVFVDEG